jgi:hypothetical protein
MNFTVTKSFLGLRHHYLKEAGSSKSGCYLEESFTLWSMSSVGNVESVFIANAIAFTTVLSTGGKIWGLS